VGGRKPVLAVIECLPNVTPTPTWRSQRSANANTCCELPAASTFRAATSRNLLRDHGSLRKTELVSHQASSGRVPGRSREHRRLACLERGSWPTSRSAASEFGEDEAESCSATYGLQVVSIVRDIVAAIG
jgi:hypothetical protein